MSDEAYISREKIRPPLPHTKERNYFSSQRNNNLK